MAVYRFTFEHDCEDRREARKFLEYTQRQLRVLLHDRSLTLTGFEHFPAIGAHVDINDEEKLELAEVRSKERAIERALATETFVLRAQGGSGMGTKMVDPYDEAQRRREQNGDA